MSTPGAHFNPRHLNAFDLTARLQTERHRLQNIEATQRRLRQIRSTLARTAATFPAPVLQLPPQPPAPPQCWLPVKSQAILMSPAPATPPPLEWCGIPLDTAFGSPTTLELLAPAEHSGVFKSARHQAGYAALVAGWMAEKGRAARKEAEELRQEKSRLQKERADESDAFHTEFLRLLRWGKKDCILLSLDPSHNKPITVQSRFPTITAYFSRFPHRTIAWAVDDFYKYQQTKYLASLGLLRVKHRWSWFESCRRFQLEVQKLRRESEGWLASIHIPGRHNDDGEQERRRMQWEAVRKIAERCGEVGIPFPPRICPGGLTPMRFFCDDTTTPGPPETVKDEAKVKREIMEMLKCETLEEFYGKRPYIATVTTPSPGIVVANSPAPTEPASDTSSSIEFDDDGEIMDLPGAFPRVGTRAAFQDATGVRVGYSASVDGRLESAGFRQVEPAAPLEGNRGWKSVRAGWPLGLRA